MSEVYFWVAYTGEVPHGTDPKSWDMDDFPFPTCPSVIEGQGSEMVNKRVVGLFDTTEKKYADPSDQQARMY